MSIFYTKNIYKIYIIFLLKIKNFIKKNFNGIKIVIFTKKHIIMNLKKKIEKNNILIMLSHLFFIIVIQFVPREIDEHISNKIFVVLIITLITFFRIILFSIKKKIKSYKILSDSLTVSTALFWSFLLFVESHQSETLNSIVIILLMIIVGIISASVSSLFKQIKLNYVYILSLAIPTFISIFFIKEFSNIVAILFLLYTFVILRFAKNQYLIWNTLKEEKINIEKKEKEINIGNSVLGIQNKKLESALKKAELSNKAKSEFLANMSHEIRTPMNGIVGATEILKTSNLSNEEKDLLNIIENSTKSLINLINDVLYFSEISSDKLNLKNEYFNIRKSIKNLYDKFHLKANEKNIKLIVNIEDDIPNNILGDEKRLLQILSNLTQNAIKFTGKGEVLIKLKLRKKTDEELKIKFSVEDTGIGIEKNKIKKIFNSFTQIDGSIARKYGGLGLGATISKLLIELMGGRINVISPNPNIKKSDFIGTVFYFTIIFKRDLEMEKKVKKHKNFNKNNFDNVKILLADDNKINQIISKKAFENLGYKIDIAENGKVALEKIDKNKYNIIFMDIQMPVLDGMQATKKIRKNDKKIPIIAITANSMREDKDTCLNIGMNDYISKPFKINDLKEVLNKWL